MRKINYWMAIIILIIIGLSVVGIFADNSQSDLDQYIEAYAADPYSDEGITALIEIEKMDNIPLNKWQDIFAEYNQIYPPGYLYSYDYYKEIKNLALTKMSDKAKTNDEWCFVYNNAPSGSELEKIAYAKLKDLSWLFNHLIGGFF